MSEETKLKSEILSSEEEALSELNLWNPLWAYDLFPIAQSSWNRMPYAGENFQTESSKNGPGQSGQSQSDQISDNSDNSDTDDEENPSDEYNIDVSDDDTDTEPETEPDDEDAGDSPDDNVDNDDNQQSSGDDQDDNDKPDDGSELDEEEQENEDEDEDEDEQSSSEGEEEEDNDEQDNDLNGDGSNSSEIEDADTSDQNKPGDEGNIDELRDNIDDTNTRRDNEYDLEGPARDLPPEIPGLTITQNSDGTYDYHRQFFSWDEFVECAADDNLFAWKNIRESHEKHQSTAGASASFDEAVQMARYRGWPEGRSLLSELMANIYQKPEVFEIWNFDVAGMFPMVPAYLSGDPACMIMEPAADLRTQHPIVRIDYNNYVAWMVTPKDMMTRGAAVLSLANSLEDHGFHTELRVIGNCRGTLNGKSCMFRYSIIFKKPSEFLDIDRAAFALAHPACMRRLGFALLEQHAELKPGFSGFYGYITSEPNDKDDTFGNIFVPGSDGSETEATARKAVMKAADGTMSEITTVEAGND